MSLAHFVWFYLVQGHCFIDLVDPGFALVSKFCASAGIR